MSIKMDLFFFKNLDEEDNALGKRNFHILDIAFLHHHHTWSIHDIFFVPDVSFGFGFDFDLMVFFYVYDH